MHRGSNIEHLFFSIKKIKIIIGSIEYWLLYEECTRKFDQIDQRLIMRRCRISNKDSIIRSRKLILAGVNSTNPLRGISGTCPQKID